MSQSRKTIATITDARRLRDCGLSYAATGRILGVSGTTIMRWLDAGYAERNRASARALKERYRGRCQNCGAATSGSNGPDKAPPLCRVCYDAARKPEHGTIGRYHSGCACDACRAANREYARSRRGKPAPSHGLSGYGNYGCKCAKCKRAGRENNAHYYAVRAARRLLAA